MIGSHVSLNALRAFEASARHLSFTQAGLELRVTQAAISHQIKTLEDMLGVRLFRRLPRGLALTDEGQVLVPVLAESFLRIRGILNRFESGNFSEVVTVGAVGTFVTGWLLPRLASFQRSHPSVDLRVLTNNNRVDLAGEGLDFAIRFGDGSWHGTDATPLFAAPLSPVCAPEIAARLREPADLAGETLLRSYRVDEWARWFVEAGAECPPLRGPVFDSSVLMADAAAQGLGVALVPIKLFMHDLRHGRLVRPFAAESGSGAYWLTQLKSKQMTAGMRAFRAWLFSSVEVNSDGVAAHAAVGSLPGQ
jgi:LysR family transcriptional regulator of beta-lactamase